MRKINHLINPQIAERLEQQDKLSAEISQFLSLTAENRIWPILKNHRLTLLTDDPHLALQARFQQNTLGKHLSKRLNLKISALHIKLISLPFASFVQKNNGFQLSDNAAQVVRSIAQGITDSELQACVLRLVTTANTPRNQF
ncbi:hypothetical protein [Thiothrix unzii]|uniref:hypothetical protein n=1 Tax=Thiothrix unzii TaxID=111769 RepID=UPI002A371084|nr:hypothetical protein [Thiothrix unzii]MDX9989334.1 hypothetical protein [Thiothrix unzii]